MGLVVVTPPAVEPVTLQEAKTFLAVEHTEHDGIISRQLRAARRQVEGETHRALIATVCDWAVDDLASAEVFRGTRPVIELPVSPLAAFGGIYARRYDGAEDEALSPSLYSVDSLATPVRIMRRPHAVWPSSDDWMGYRIRFTAGYGALASAVPDDLREAILRLLATWYENRENLVVGTTLQELPERVIDLLSDFTVHYL